MTEHTGCCKLEGTRRELGPHRSCPSWSRRQHWRLRRGGHADEEEETDSKETFESDLMGLADGKEIKGKEIISDDLGF